MPVHSTEVGFISLFWTCTETYWEEIEDTKGVIRIYKSKKDRQHYGQMVKQQSIKHYTEN